MQSELSGKRHTVGTERHTARLTQSGKAQGQIAATLLEEEQRKLIQVIHKKVLNHNEI